VQNILGASVVPTAIEAPADPEVEEALSGTPPKAAAKPAPEKAAAAISKAKTVTEDEVETAVAAAEKPAKAAAKPAAGKVVVPEDDMDLDLDGISFDD
jgi:hypothetical protein